VVTIILPETDANRPPPPDLNMRISRHRVYVMSRVDRAQLRTSFPSDGLRLRAVNHSGQP
jgi:hypothetical protein